MKTRTIRMTSSLIAAGMLVASAPALATNGYFTHGVGTQSKGMAGSGVGSNADMGAIMSASNPALGTFVSDQWEIGLSVFSPRRSYTAGESDLDGQLIGPLPNGEFLPSHTITPGKIDSSSEYFPIPYVAKNWSLANDGNFTFAFYGRGGMNTDWDDANASATSYLCGANPDATPATGQGPYCAGVAGVNLSQAFVALNYSAKIGDNFAWGIGPVLAFQMFEAKGVGTFVPITQTCADGFNPATQECGAFPTSLTDNGDDTSFGYGLALGAWWGITDRVSLGLAYQTEMEMDEFDKYSDLFAESGGFNIPSSLKAGLSFMVDETMRINVDVEHITYSDIKSIANPMANMAGCPTLPLGGTDLEGCLGGSNGAGFGWEDMTVYKLGFEWTMDSNNIWRFGYSYGEQPIQSADVLFNILAPGVMEQHITFGWTHIRERGGMWNASFMYAPEKTVSGPSFLDPTQNIDLKMSQFEFEVSYRF